LEKVGVRQKNKTDLIFLYLLSQTCAEVKTDLLCPMPESKSD